MSDSDSLSCIACADIPHAATVAPRAPLVEEKAKWWEFQKVIAGRRKLEAAGCGMTEASRTRTLRVPLDSSLILAQAPWHSGQSNPALVAWHLLKRVHPHGIRA